MRIPKIGARLLTGAALSLALATSSVFLARRAAAGSEGDGVRPSNHTPEPVGKIAFSSERDGNYEIYVMNPDGGGATRLTTNDTDDREPVWSPDGTRIAFVSDRGVAAGTTDIYVLSVSSPDTGFTPPTRLTANAADDFQPAWSPDGSKIAFTSSRDGNDEIYVMNADGTGQANVSNSPGDDFEPSWSPNGQRIAFTSTRDVNEEIYVMDATGGGQANISNNTNGDERHPSWGGTRIAFQSTRDGNEEIYSMNADGTGQTRLTNNPAADTEPWLSLDGQRIAFASNRDNPAAFEIYTMQSNGTGQTRLTRNGDDNDFEAAFQQQSPPVIGVIVSGSIQLASANTSVSENAGKATVTVTRTGGTTGTAVVDFAATSGSASERSDFTTAIGTLTFNEGETQKTFDIFITNDAFAEFDETINVTLSNATNATLGSTNAGTVTITDDDVATAAANPIDDDEFFVRQHYIDFFNREPEPSGFNAWVNLLRNCPNKFNTASTGPSVQCDRITVSSAFVRSPEYQLKGYYVIRFYLAAFGRLPTYLEFVRDIRRIDAPTAEQVAANQTAYAVEFTRRQDFRGVYDPLSNQQYVDRLAQVTGVSPANRAQMVADLNSGAKTRAQVLREFVENAQFTAKEFNRGFVASQYYGYLRRDPEVTGFNAWLTFLNANPNDFRTMVNGFMNSTEYRRRFGNP